MSNKFDSFLNGFSEDDWLAVIDSLLPEIHEVDRNAVQIWFRFYPLELFRYLKAAGNKEESVKQFLMQGNYELADQIDSSHHFLYGHRFWKSVKTEIEKRAESFDGNGADPEEEIRMIAVRLSEKFQTEQSLFTAITAVGLMTLAQVGYEQFSTVSGDVKRMHEKLPEEILKRRRKDDSQGLFGFLKTVDKRFTITYDETKPKGKFPIINDEEIASAAARDQSQNWKEIDERCIEGVIPVECRSASCGTCWIGVLAGKEKLSQVASRERKQMKVFGYRQPKDEKPFLRLACQARAFGNATIVIPPWNGVFGKKVYHNVEDVELEPATTSARERREIVKDAVKNQLM